MAIAASLVKPMLTTSGFSDVEVRGLQRLALIGASVTDACRDRRS
jgi:hypothetical protein